jgi:hypothetical protein
LPIPVNCPQDAITSFLRQGGAQGISGIAWGSNASPCYQEAPETPLLAFPYVVYDIDPSTLNHTFEALYEEQYVVTVKVVGLEAHIQSVMLPYVAGSVFDLLDSVRNSPDQLSGQSFKCIKFTREDWRLYKETIARGPTTERVWISEAKYDYWTNYNYLNSAYGSITATGN